MKGYVQWVLHAHLPYVCHDDQPYCLEHDWYFEALSETYFPLLVCLQRQARLGRQHLLTLSLSPSLLRMMENRFLWQQYGEYLDEHLQLAQAWLASVASESSEAVLAQHYVQHYTQIQVLYRNYPDPELWFKAWSELADRAVITLITTAYTHAYLPLWNDLGGLVDEQVRLGKQTFERCLNRPVRGFWLPECGYYPGFESVLKKHGFDYTFLETHGVLQAEPQPSQGVFSPLVSPNGLVVYGRDATSTKWIWSASEGYPGACYYRDFYCDWAYEAEHPLLDSYRHKRGAQTMTGLKTRQVGYRDQAKAVYNPSLGKALAVCHAELFAQNVIKRVKQVQVLGVDEPLLTLCFDAELFGHWWWEGLCFLEAAFDQLAKREDDVALWDPNQPCLHNWPVGQPALSSWGQGGYHRMWLHPDNDWIYREVHKLYSQREMLGESSQQLKQFDTLMHGLVASDWMFMLATRQSSVYAKQRVEQHLADIKRLFS